MNENVKRILDQHKHSPDLVQAYEKAVNSMSPTDLQSLIDNRVDCLLFEIAKNHGWVPSQYSHED